MRDIKIIFKSGREITLSLYDDESFELFWKKSIVNNYFIAGDIMFNICEVEYSETII